MSKFVIVTGTGCIASALVRAFVPAGYNVRTIGLADTGVTVFRELGPNWQSTPEAVQKLLKSKKGLDPFLVLPTYRVPHTQQDLSEPFDKSLFDGCDFVVVAAGNGNSNQPENSAKRNARIDKNTLEAVLACGVKDIAYVSSVWTNGDAIRGDDPAGGYIKPEMHLPPKDRCYAQVKAATVAKIKDLAAQHKDKTFMYTDHGWYPRETIGCPISNMAPEFLQWWFAESEMQQLYLHLADIRNNPAYQDRIKQGENVFGFNGFSPNIPPEHLHHRKFPWDLSNTERLGVKHMFNVYDVLSQGTYEWRKIPIPSD